MKKIIPNLSSITSGRSRILRKVLIIYILMAIFPIILISTLAYTIYYRSILKEAYALVEQNTRQHETIVSQRISDYRTILYELVSDKQFIKLAQQIAAGEEQTQENTNIVNKFNMETIMENYSYSDDGIRSIAYLADNKDYVGYSKWYGSINEVIWSQEEQRTDLYAQVKQKRELLYFPAMNLSRGKAHADYVIMLGFPVRNLMTKESAGVVLIALDDSILNFDGQTEQFNQSKPEETGVTTVIVDETGKILASDYPEEIRKPYESFLTNHYKNQNRIYQWKETISQTDWKIISIIDQDIYLESIHMFTYIVVIFTVVITLIFFILVFFIFRRYTYTISKIAQGIGCYAGDSGEEMELDKKDELYVIVSQFNRMTKRISGLVDMLKQKNHEIETAVTRQKHAEIKVLEAQINPHFLFNTLDSINWQAIEHEEEEISDMLGALGSLLRYSISNIETVVVLAAEISWLRKYIFLQRSRFNNSFDCEYHIQEEALQFPIYKMLLQPIVENIILHGFEGIEFQGRIYVESYIQKDGRLRIRFRDNGIGIEAEKLRMIQGEIIGGGQLNSKSIGISNIINRLRIYYGDQADVSIDSTVGVGTEMTLIIPNTYCKEEGTL